jgi:acetolactate synthase I/II/III large subunit
MVVLPSGWYLATGFGLSSSVFVWPGVSEHIQTAIDSGAALTKKIAEAITARKPHLLELLVPGDLSFWEGVWSFEGLEGLSAMTRQCDRGASARAA